MESPKASPKPPPPAPKPAPKPVPPPPAQKPVEPSPSPAAPAPPPASPKFVPLEPTEAPKPSTPSPAPRVSPPKTSAAPRSQKGVIVAEEATVFKDPNFDASVIATVETGKILEMSLGKKDVFYRVRLKPGLTGWISDADIRPVDGDGASSPAKVSSGKKSAKKELKPVAKKKKAKPIQMQRYRGLACESVNFAEDTMGRVRSSSLGFCGVRWSGNNVVIPGEMYTDGEILYHLGAPPYYTETTGAASGGFIILANFMFITDLPQSRDLMAYYGFGPMFRFSQFQADLNNDPTAGKTKSYQLTDAAVGAVFGAGVAVAIGDRYAVRLDGRYYWEAQRYTSFSLAIQMEW